MANEEFFKRRNKKPRQEWDPHWLVKLVYMVFSVALDDSTAEFYRRVAALMGLPVETVLSDALFKLAGELSLEAIHKTGRS